MAAGMRGFRVKNSRYNENNNTSVNGEEEEEEKEEIRLVVSPYRICPLGAHIDHQGGIVSAMTINKGILLAFVPSNDARIVLRSSQFDGLLQFMVDETQHPKLQNEKLDWGCYAKGAIYELQRSGHNLTKGNSSCLSSSVAAGVAYLLALEYENHITLSAQDNIELDRLIENQYLGLNNGILDQSVILLSKYGNLTIMDCQTKQHTLVESLKLHSEKGNAYKKFLAFSGLKQSLANHPTDYNSRVSECKQAVKILSTTSGNQEKMRDCLNISFSCKTYEFCKASKILLAFSGLKQSLANHPDYNSRVSECKEAAKILSTASGNNEISEPLLCDVDFCSYEAHKNDLDVKLAKRAEHYFSENKRVKEGKEAWRLGNLEEFGKLISASGQSSIENYECGSKQMKELYDILVKAPGVYGARFSGAGFRGCCLAIVDANKTEEATSFIEQEYKKVQPELVSQLEQGRVVLICDAGDSARVL